MALVMSFPAARRRTYHELFTDDLAPLDEQDFGARVKPHRRELHVQTPASMRSTSARGGRA
jgi:hypothetical protein